MEESKRTTQSTGPSIKDHGKIGEEIKFEKDPKYIAQREQVYDRIMKQQQEQINSFPKQEINITMKDGTVRKGVSWETTPLAIAKELSNSLAKKAVVAKVLYSNRVGTLDEGLANTGPEVEGQDETWTLYDLERPLEGDCQLQILTFEDDEGKMVFWHSSAHILGECLECNYGVHLCYGPPTQDGFYYDAYCGQDKFAESHYKDIEKKAKMVTKAKQKFERIVLTKEEALEMFAYNPFKVQLIQNKVPEGGKTTAYRCGPLIDLCTGPHVPTTGAINSFKIMKNSSSYWLANAENDSLQRVYGVSFPDKKQMDEYIKFIEEAKLRDHRKVGADQELFYHHEYSPGSWFFTPDGAYIYNELVEFMRTQYRYRGFSEVISPNIFNLRLWKVSGHYQKYKENLFMFKDEDMQCGYGIKPMNCPGHFLLYQSKIRSYKELPIRYADFGVLHRNEIHGALSGLTRVRRFQQDDAHIFCRQDQIKDEIKQALDFVDYVYNIFGFTYELYLSTKPENYLGDDSIWETAENQLKESLNEFGKPWQENPGDGAFYGPKIDIKLFDALKRSHQCGTIQLDFQAPIRFNLDYRTDHDELQSPDKANDSMEVQANKYFDFPADEYDPEVFRWEEKRVRPGYARPVIIHRAVLGSVERFFSILTEHIAGKWPVWLSPRQVIILPVSEQFMEYAEVVNKAFEFHGIRSSIDNKDRKLTKKIREAEVQHWSYILTVGQFEQDLGMVDVRESGGKQLGKMRVNEFMELIKEKSKPEPSSLEKQKYENMWTPNNFPFDQAKYDLMLEEERKQKEAAAEEFKKKQAEKEEAARKKKEEADRKQKEKQLKKQQEKEAMRKQIEERRAKEQQQKDEEAKQ